MVVRLGTNNMAEHCPQDHPQDHQQDTIADDAEEYDRNTQRWLDLHLECTVDGRGVTVNSLSSIGENLLTNYKKGKPPSPHIETLDIHKWIDQRVMADFKKTNVAPSCVYDAKRMRDADEEESDEDEEESDEDEEESDDDEQHAKRVCV